MHPGGTMNPKSYLLLLATVSCSVTGQIIMKKGTADMANGLKGIVLNPQIMGGGFFYVLAFVFWLNVLKNVPLSIAFPFNSLSYVLILFASRLFLGEALTVPKIIGVAFILVGVVFISRG
jgi:drug/metabolite transporter (DMT)-like permease